MRDMRLSLTVSEYWCDEVIPNKGQKPIAAIVFTPADTKMNRSMLCVLFLVDKESDIMSLARTIVDQNKKKYVSPVQIQEIREGNIQIVWYQYENKEGRSENRYMTETIVQIGDAKGTCISGQATLFSAKNTPEELDTFLALVKSIEIVSLPTMQTSQPVNLTPLQ